MTQVKKAYVTAADEVAEKVRVAELADVSDLTVESWKQIDLQLAQSVKGIRETLEEEATEAVGNTASRITAIDQKYLTDITTVLDPVKIANMYVRVNEELISNMATRMFADGYTFSQRIWGVGDAFQGDIKQVILSGLSQGRDPVKIADDLQVYIADGKVKLMQRYGNLEAGTKEFAKRIPKNVDYRAMRLVRTEVYASLKEAGVIAGQRNPGAEDLFDWVMQSGRAHWDCECPDYAHNSPYTAAQVPVQPHPNCHPAGTMITMAAGGEVPIEDVMVGDLVLSHDGSTNQVINTFRRMHAGAIYRFKTTEGYLSATDEHPLLSDGEWVEAKLLKRGDNLTRVRREIVPLTIGEAEALDYPSLGLKEFRLLVVLRDLLGGVVPVPTIYLDGQLYFWESEVNGKDSLYEVWDRLLTALAKGSIEDELVLGPSGAFIALGSLNELFIRNDSTTDSGMGLLDIGLEAVLVKPGHSLTDIQWLISSINEIPVDASPGQSKSLGDLIDREILVDEELGQNFLFNILFNTHNTTIVGVTCEEVKTVVYNMEVADVHTFVANGFASHNCGCYLVPHLRDRDEFVNDLVRWASGESVDYLDDWADRYYYPA